MYPRMGHLSPLWATCASVNWTSSGWINTGSQHFLHTSALRTIILHKHSFLWSLIFSEQSGLFLQVWEPPVRDPIAFNAAALPQGEHPSWEHSRSAACSSPCVRIFQRKVNCQHSLLSTALFSDFLTPDFIAPCPSSPGAEGAELPPAVGSLTPAPSPEAVGIISWLMIFFPCMMSLVPVSDSFSSVSNNFPTCHRSRDPAAAWGRLLLASALPGLPFQHPFCSYGFWGRRSLPRFSVSAWLSYFILPNTHQSDTFDKCILLCHLLIPPLQFHLLGPKLSPHQPLGHRKFHWLFSVPVYSCFFFFFNLLAFKIIIAYYLCMCLWCVWVCSQVVFIICSFPSGSHVNFVYIGLHIEGDIIHPCTSKVCGSVCMQAAYCIHLFMCVQHVPVCVTQRWASVVVCSARSTSLSAC